MNSIAKGVLRTGVGLVFFSTLMSAAYSYDIETVRKQNAEFSKGRISLSGVWPDSIIDVHVHSAGEKIYSEADLKERLDNYFDAMRGLWVYQVCLFIDPANWDRYKEVYKSDSRVVPIIYPKDKKHFNAKYLEKVAKEGIKGVKLHNRGLLRRKYYKLKFLESKQAHGFYSICEKYGLPIVWHYITGPYGKDHGQEKEFDFTYQDLLDSQLRICKKHPKLAMVGAHYNGMGPEFLDKTMDEYPNFYVDLSAQAQCSWGQHFTKEQKKRLSTVLIKHSDRFLFGTDNAIAAYKKDIETSRDLVKALRTYDWVCSVTISAIRYLSELALPKEAFNKIAHKNAVKLYGLSNDK